MIGPDAGPADRLDLASYLARIGYRGTPAATVDALESLHLAHATAIPFENLDILLGRPIRLDLGSLQQKLVAERRGGYCFEQNLLFGAVLESVGFEVTFLSARVRYGATVVRPRTHMLLQVTHGDQRWVADVGFGGEGLLRPVPLVVGSESVQFRWTYRLIEEGRHLVLQSRRSGEWLDMYAFTLEPQERVDYEVANHFTSTHPSSPFRMIPIVQRPSQEARYILRDRELTIDTGDTVTTRTIAQRDVLRVLAQTFGIELPAETRL